MPVYVAPIDWLDESFVLASVGSANATERDTWHRFAHIDAWSTNKYQELFIGNHGGKGGTGQYKACMRFRLDQIPPNSVINSAKLTLIADSTVASSITMDMAILNRDRKWDRQFFPCPKPFNDTTDHDDPDPEWYGNWEVINQSFDRDEVYFGIMADWTLRTAAAAVLLDTNPDPANLSEERDTTEYYRDINQEVTTNWNSPTEKKAVLISNGIGCVGDVEVTGTVADALLSVVDTNANSGAALKCRVWSINSDFSDPETDKMIPQTLLGISDSLDISGVNSGNNTLTFTFSTTFDVTAGDKVFIEAVRTDKQNEQDAEPCRIRTTVTEAGMSSAQSFERCFNNTFRGGFHDGSYGGNGALGNMPTIYGGNGQSIFTSTAVERPSLIFEGSSTAAKESNGVYAQTFPATTSGVVSEVTLSDNLVNAIERWVASSHYESHHSTRIIGFAFSTTATRKKYRGPYFLEIDYIPPEQVNIT